MVRGPGTALIALSTAAFVVGAASLGARQAESTDLITKAGWECVPNASVVDGAVVVSGGPQASTTLNDNEVRLETGPDVTISLTLESTSGPGFVGLNFWNSLPPVGDATNWYSTAPKVSLGLLGGRPAIRVYDGGSNMPAFQFTVAPPAPTGPVSVSVSHEGDELVLRAAGKEATRTRIVGSLTGGPLFFGPLTAANKNMTVRRFVVTDGAHPNGATIVRAVAPAAVSSATTTLRAAAAARGREIGVGLVQRVMRWDQRTRDVAAREFNLLSAVDQWGFNTLRPSRDQYRFCGADQVIAFAEANRMRVHGGSGGLLWGRVPDWLAQRTFTRDQMIDILQQHIRTVVSRYRGHVHVWNVVNEVHDSVGNLQKGDQQIWMRVIGPEYIDMAFRWAHEADPQATLLFNSVNDEGTVCLMNCGPGRAPGSRNLKADALYEMVKGLRARGVPVDGVGMQTHWGDFQRYPTVDPTSVAAQMKRLSDLGLDVYITEMDAPVQRPATPATLADQASKYVSMLRTCLAAANCKSLIVFGVDDGHWAEPPAFARAGVMPPGTLIAPFLFDASFAPKPAYAAMLAALQN